MGKGIEGTDVVMVVLEILVEELPCCCSKLGMPD